MKKLIPPGVFPLIESLRNTLSVGLLIGTIKLRITTQVWTPTFPRFLQLTNRTLGGHSKR